MSKGLRFEVSKGMLLIKTFPTRDVLILLLNFVGIKIKDRLIRPPSRFCDITGFESVLPHIAHSIM